MDKYNNFESAFDNHILYPLADKLIPILHDYELTPNWITTISSLFTIFSALLILKRQYILASLSYLIGYFFDCMDGRMARKYNQSSLFGEAYDFTSDTITTAIVVLALIYSSRKNIKLYQIALIGLFFFMISFWFYNVETYHSLTKTGNIDYIEIKQKRFDEQEHISLMSDLYFYFLKQNKESMDKVVEYLGGFEKQFETSKKFLSYIGSGHSVLFLCIIIILFSFNK